MKAIVQRRYGDDASAVLALADVARPSPGPGEVLVHVAAASVDMGTWHCMTGRPYAMRLMGFGARAPKAPNPGRAFAGTVSAVGDEVTTLQPGDPVYGTADGAFAEYVVAEAGMVAAKPPRLSFEAAAAAPVSGVTALQAVRQARGQQGDRVLVVGASGGVGTYAVQLAASLGAEVTGVCSGAKADLVRSLGAHHVVDRTAGALADGDTRYDAVIVTGGNRPLGDLRRALTERGTLVLVGGESGGRWLGGVQRSIGAALLSPFVRQRLVMLTAKENATDLDALGGLLEAGSVTSALDRTHALADAAAAIDHLRAGRAAGKVVLAV